MDKVNGFFVLHVHKSWKSCSRQKEHIRVLSWFDSEKVLAQSDKKISNPFKQSIPMAKIFIDGIECEAHPKQTIIQIADGINNGGKEIVDIPRFCYHPALSIAGNCRMCLVEFGMPGRNKDGSPQVDENGKPVIRWMPKLTTACSTEIADGMHVKTHHTSHWVADAQKGVLEFILINHPLDCPICDQAGECPLQQITYKYGPEESRYEFEKVHKPKREKWGTKIVFDGERCINCTRCVRFFDQYTETHELEIVQRGWNNYPALTPGMTPDENRYAMNVIDLCPVGALTSSDHRFNARVWEMSATDTISVADARCSSVRLWVRDNRVMRLTARPNPLVNGFFISDDDRLDYKWINDNRADVPKIKVGNAQQTADWQGAIQKVAEVLRRYQPNEIFVLASARASLETNFIVKKLTTEILKTPHLDFLRHIEGADDALLIRADKTPNALGCEMLGIAPAAGGLSADDLPAAVRSGKIKCVLAIEDTVEEWLLPEVRAKLQALILLPYNLSDAVNEADVVLPAATFAEQIGTFLNFEGVLQLARPAKALKHQNRELMKEMALSRWDKHATQFDRWSSEENKIDAKPAWEILSELSGALGTRFRYQTAREIFTEIVNSLSAFKDLDYQKLGKIGVKLDGVRVY